MMKLSKTDANLKIKIKKSPLGAPLFIIKHRMFTQRNITRALPITCGAKSLRRGGGNAHVFKGLHRGNACFIVGNGPSLTLADLEKVHASGISSFGTNRISDLFHQCAWRPTYMCAMEHGFLNRTEGTQSIAEYTASLKDSGVTHVFLNKRHSKGVGDQYKDFITYVTCSLAPLYSTCLQPFSDDIESYVADLGSVVHFCIQIACYMGFTKIYLLGVDNTYSKYLGLDGLFHVEERQKSHAEGIAKVADDEPALRVPKNAIEAYRMGGFADMRKNNLGYLMCKEYAVSHGIQVFNVTRGGALEVFERLDFDSVVQKEGTRSE